MVGFKFGSIVTSRTRTTCELKAPQIIGFHSRAFLPLIDFHPSTIPAYKTLKLLSDLLNKDDIAEDMEQPLNPSPQQLPPTTASVSGGGRNSDNNNSDSQKRRLPTPQELMSHYESQGLEPQEAAVKVIDDLQHMLYKLATSGKREEGQVHGRSFKEARHR
ncbi:hypothetical protein Nepgr_019384 [Nepenthes gracilis]|uniref:Uncharacterized protein n=1 Tax=Nepenthes gracilis TaxID=150966 RepID=A0AAD3STX8_NEPGR|nr:hypothetical protein Nepgr_019384 [Nepenthes gracilis]